MFLDRIVYWSLLYEEKVWYTFLVNIISCSTAGFSEIVSTNISENRIKIEEKLDHDIHKALSIKVSSKYLKYLFRK